MREGFLKKDIQERYNSKRAWFVNAWRIVGKDGKDMVQPWSNTKKEARETAKHCGIHLTEINDNMTLSEVLKHLGYSHYNAGYKNEDLHHIVTTKECYLVFTMSASECWKWLRETSQIKF